MNFYPYFESDFEKHIPMRLAKPKVLKRGDKIATISLSWGGAGELLQRYEQGKQQLQNIFGVEVVETKNALKPAQWIYENPKARAEDLMEAFADKSIKAIISNIGGDDSIRILRYVDLEIIRHNPKILLGFSDTTISHFLCLKAGLSSFYGTSLLVGFAENGGMHQYQIDDIERTLFSTKPVGQIFPSEGWTSEMLDWSDSTLQNKKRKLTKNLGWNFLQGNKKVQGRLIGGCIDALESLKGTKFWATDETWQDSILFFEVSEDMPKPEYFGWWLRNYAEQGILKKANGIILGRPFNNQYLKEYNDELLKIMKEENLTEMPIITEMDFGHTCPTFTIPYGVRAEIDSLNKSFSILESGVEE